MPDGSAVRFTIMLAYYAAVIYFIGIYLRPILVDRYGGDPRDALVEAEEETLAQPEETVDDSTTSTEELGAIEIFTNLVKGIA